MEKAKETKTKTKKGRRTKAVGDVSIELFSNVEMLIKLWLVEHKDGQRVV